MKFFKKLTFTVVLLTSGLIFLLVAQAHSRFELNEIDLNSNGSISFNEYYKSLNLVKVIKKDGCIHIKDGKEGVVTYKVVCD